jgi:hypothetical protein
MQVKDGIPRALTIRPFGRKGVAGAMQMAPHPTLANDLKLFAVTFAAGFLFMTLYLA